MTQSTYAAPRKRGLTTTLAIGLLGLASLTLSVWAAPTSWTEPGEQFPGGATTFKGFGSQGKDAFRQRLTNLHSKRRNAFQAGRSIFRDQWVMAPSSTKGLDGLGPAFNTRSCSSCHFRDGRSPAPTPGTPLKTTIVKLSIPGQDAHGAPLPDPRYGGELSPNAILKVKPEGHTYVHYQKQVGTFADGTKYTLRKPVYTIKALAYGTLHPKVMTSIRVAPHIVGVGLLEAIPKAAILHFQDAKDRDKDGISGRANWVWDAVAKRKALGRFGWKASQPNVRQQVAGALLGDMGITSPINPTQNCPPGQRACRKAPNGGTPEINKRDFADLVLYTRTLAVPKRRDWKSTNILRGKQLFRQANCHKCHVPKWKTGKHPTIPALSHQLIWPYTDMLLHDMGPELADNRPEFKATGREWRTPPLWGIGKIKITNKHTTLLHDGRARNVSEAILWHGGEAKRAKDAFRHMNQRDRNALVAFVNSL